MDKRKYYYSSWSYNSTIVAAKNYGPSITKATATLTSQAAAGRWSCVRNSINTWNWLRGNTEETVIPK